MNFNEIYELAQAIKKIYPNTLESIIQTSSNTTLYQGKQRESIEKTEQQNTGAENNWEKIVRDLGEYSLEVYVHQHEYETVQKTLESLILFTDQIAAHKTKKYGKPSVNLLMNYLFHAKSPEILANASLLASEMGYNLEEGRVLCLFDFDESEENLSLLERYKKNLLLCITDHIPNPQQSIVANHGNHQIVLCIPISQNLSGLKSYLNGILERILKNISTQFGLESSIGISSLITSASGYKEALSSAQAAIKYGKLFDSCKISYIEDFSLDYSIESIPTEVLDRYLSPYIAVIENNPDFFRTIEALLIHELNLSNAASELYIHKNTLINRVSLLKNSLHLDPLGNDSDCFLLYIIYHYYLLRQNMQPSNSLNRK